MSLRGNASLTVKVERGLGVPLALAPTSLRHTVPTAAADLGMAEVRWDYTLLILISFNWQTFCTKLSLSFPTQSHAHIRQQPNRKEKGLTYAFAAATVTEFRDW
jgi:hypothetical protein